MAGWLELAGGFVVAGRFVETGWLSVIGWLGWLVQWSSGPVVCTVIGRKVKGESCRITQKYMCFVLSGKIHL